MTEGRSLSGKQAIRVDWIRFRVTAAMLRSSEWDGELEEVAKQEWLPDGHAFVQSTGRREQVGREGDERRKLWEGWGELEGSYRRG